MENLNQTPSAPEDNQPNQWDTLREEPKYLEFGTEVSGGYKIASMPFQSKTEAYQQISESWQNEPNVTTYYHQDSDQWYIVTK